jgi:hypothetical protein
VRINLKRKSVFPPIWKPGFSSTSRFQDAGVDIQGAQGQSSCEASGYFSGPSYLFIVYFDIMCLWERLENFFSSSIPQDCNKKYAISATFTMSCQCDAIIELPIKRCWCVFDLAQRTLWNCQNTMMRYLTPTESLPHQTDPSIEAEE